MSSLLSHGYCGHWLAPTVLTPILGRQSVAISSRESYSPHPESAKSALNDPFYRERRRPHSWRAAPPSRNGKQTPCGRGRRRSSSTARPPAFRPSVRPLPIHTRRRVILRNEQTNSCRASPARAAATLDSWADGSAVTTLAHLGCESRNMWCDWSPGPYAHLL